MAKYSNSTTIEHKKELSETFIKKLDLLDLKKLPRSFTVNINDLLKLMNFHENRSITLLQRKRKSLEYIHKMKKILKKNKNINGKKRKLEEPAVTQTIAESKKNCAPPAQPQEVKFNDASFYLRNGDLNFPVVKDPIFSLLKIALKKRIELNQEIYFWILNYFQLFSFLILIASLNYDHFEIPIFPNDSMRNNKPF